MLLDQGVAQVPLAGGEGVGAGLGDGDGDGVGDGDGDGDGEGAVPVAGPRSVHSDAFAGFQPVLA